VLMMSTSLQYMFQPTIPFHPVTSYFWWNYSTLPPDVTYNSRWGTEVSYCCSSFFYPNSTSDNIDDIIASNPLINDTINRSAHMDTVFPQMAQNEPDIAQIEIGFSQTKTYRRYPAINIYRTRDYDAQLRPWYLSAVGTTNLAYSPSPYINSETGKWTIAISKSVYTQSGLLAVAAVEMRISSIESDILSQVLYQTGYAILIQTDGTVVAGRFWKSDLLNNTINLETVSNLFSQIQPLGTARSSSLSFNGTKVFVSQSAIIRNKYIVINVVPQSEVLSAASAITARVDANFTQVIGITAAVGIATLIIVYLLSIVSAATITKPIVVVSDTAMKIASNATKENVMENIELKKEFDNQDEVGDLARAFKSMVNHLSGAASPKTHNTGESGIELKRM